MHPKVVLSVFLYAYQTSLHARITGVDERSPSVHSSVTGCSIGSPVPPKCNRLIFTRPTRKGPGRIEISSLRQPRMKTRRWRPRRRRRLCRNRFLSEMYEVRSARATERPGATRKLLMFLNPLALLICIILPNSPRSLGTTSNGERQQAAMQSKQPTFPKAAQNIQEVFTMRIFVRHCRGEMVIFLHTIHSSICVGPMGDTKSWTKNPRLSGATAETSRIRDRH